MRHAVKTAMVLVATTLLIAAKAQRPAQPSAAAPGAAADHHEAVASRGDHAMGFSHETTTHHFRLYKTGGAIEVSVNDATDAATREQIHMHLSHIVKLFSAGDFNVPMFIHDTTPPGAPTMSRLREQIRYRYQETPAGGRIRITTANREALQAIHDFLRFQITDHQTGDTTKISD